MDFETLLSEMEMTKTALAERLGLNLATVFRWGAVAPRYAMAYLELAYKVKTLAKSLG